MTFAMAKTSELWSGRQPDLASKNNYASDCLSRTFVRVIYLGLDYTAMVAAANSDIQALPYSRHQTVSGGHHI